MANIRVMSDLLANKIAAGEVVERCLSVVKELVENSVDAKSDEIKIELIESGLRSIKVIDNGSGMDKDDAVLAFQRHATSKLYSEDDLFNISSLGFRGEALPSIASVSEVELKTSSNGVGTYVHIKGGNIIEVKESDLAKGTSFTITNLFYNTPARLKHLSSSYAELANIVEYVHKMALSYPNIKFILVNDGRELFNTSGDGNLLKVINAIYGINVVKKMIKIDNKNNDYEISGYISLPEVNRSSKNYISTLVNGRVVKNYQLSKIINESYSTFKEDTRYPIVVINIKTDPSLLDVNIHPSKLDIKFSNMDELIKLIQTTIINTLKDKLLIPKIEVPTNDKVETKYENMSLDLNRTVSEEDTAYTSKLSDLVNFNNQDSEDLSGITDENELLNKITEVEIQEENKKLPELYPIGVALGTYIVCQNELGVYLIDQHAAKERINYEIVLYNLSHPNNNVMTPLIPINIELPLNEYLIIKQNIEILNKINIQVEEFGSSSFRVISHPTWINKGFEVQTIKHIFEMIVCDEKNFSLERFIDNVAKMVSCKMSIKGNTRINIEEMESLINDLRKCNNPFNCPHGRPTIIHFTIYELEKMFKRSI